MWEDIIETTTAGDAEDPHDGLAERHAGPGTLTESATVRGRVNPAVGATVTFTLFAPGDTTCTGAPVFTPAAVAYPVAGGAVGSPPFTRRRPGSTGGSPPTA